MESNSTPDETAAFEDSSGDWFKVIIIGDAGVGKTSILLRFIEDKFIQTTTSIGYISDRKKTIKVNGKEVQLHVWDTAGQERYMSITNRYYRDTDAVIIVYDCCAPETFHNIQKWYSEVYTYLAQELDDGMPVMVAANKKDKLVDLNSSMECVNFKIAERSTMDRELFACIETSAKTGEGVKMCLRRLLKNCCIVKDRNRQDMLIMYSIKKANVAK